MDSAARRDAFLPTEANRDGKMLSLANTSPLSVTDLLANEPFVGRARLNGLSVMARGIFDFAVAVPVREEVDLLPQMVAALSVAMKASNKTGIAVFCINNSRDHSAELIVRLLVRHRLPGLVVIVDFHSAIRNASHARRLALDVAQKYAPRGTLLTTDADSEVGPAWVIEAIRQLSAGYDLICEDVRLNAAGLAALPRQVRQVGNVERSYYNACDELWHWWSGDIDGFAHRASGASLAFRTSTYANIGGLPVPDCGEDAALCAMVLAKGGRVITISDGGTRTSARLDSRAQGGCGAALERRAKEIDPVCDAALVPVEELKRLARYRWHHGVRKPLRQATTPLRMSDVMRELAKAQALLGARGKS